MNVVRLELKQIVSTKADRQLAELRYWLPGQTQYKSRKLELAEIAELYDFIDRDFSTRNLNLLQLGRRLFDWLDGNERWLAQAIEQQGRDLVLAIDAQDQVFHLTGHGNIKDGVPYFVTESLEGDLVAAQVADLAAVFSFRYPTLIFLSGCRTGESASKGVTSSLAAMVLYQRLSQGFTVAQALALTYQELLKVEVPDWCLLRLYAKFDCWGKLVLPPGDAVRWRRPEASEDEEFLDAQGLVRVAGKNAFVGRRRYLQRGLKALKSSRNLGIWLHGLGGAGKSSIACRLLDRLAPSYQKLVLTGDFDESLLVNKLVKEFADKQDALNISGSLVQRLTTALKDVGQRQNERIVFLLDNLEMLADGKWVLKAAVVEPLQALLNGIVKSQVHHRVIVTSRFDVVLPGGLERQIHRLAVGSMGRDSQKLYRRLKAFQSEASVDVGLQTKAQEIADGYPRLMGWLNDVLLDERTDSELILLAMEGKQQDFLENILAKELLAQQEPGLVEMLERGDVV
jgi:NACHT domain